MKVLIIAPHYYPYLGGLENYARHIAMGLSERGHEVIIVTSNQGSRRTQISEIDGIKIYRLAYRVRIFNTPVSLLWRRQLRSLIKEINPDVINAHTPVPYISDLVERVRGKIPYVLTYHNDLIKTGFVLNLICKLEYLALTKKTLRRASSIIGTSQTYMERSQYLPTFLDKCRVVAPGVDSKVFSRKAETPMQLSVLFVGQLNHNHSHKGLKVLLNSMALLKTKKVELLIVGEGDASEHYRKYASELGVTSVAFMGRLSDKQLASTYRRASVLVLPSTSAAEGFGMVILEAAACGTPTVASNIGGIGEAVQNGQTGLLVEPNNARVLAETLDIVLSNSELRSQLGTQAYERAVSEFNWDVQTQKTEVILMEAIRSAL